MSDNSSTAVFDGSLAGLLCIVFDAFALDLRIDRVERTDRHAPGMFGQTVEVSTHVEHAQRVWKGLRAVQGFDERLVLKCWLFDSAQSDADIVYLLVRLFQDGLAATRDYRDVAVLRCKKVAQQMGRETHRTHAFVRFEQAADGLYFAVIEPDFNVLPLAVTHFEDRYQDQEWLLWDGKRNYGYWFTPGQSNSVRVYPTPEAAAPGTGFGESRATAPAEAGFQDLWSTYFESVNISARDNPKLHRQHVPQRYWRHLTEKRQKHTDA